MPNLWIKKNSNLFTIRENYGFPVCNYRKTIKLIFYIKNKKAVDLKLQHRVSGINLFSRYLSPETY